MTYEQCVAYLHHPPRFPKTPSLDRIKMLMCLLGNPQESLRFLHIAGTNGKGSVAAMTASVLTVAGYRTGLFTSPYLEKFEERLVINGVPISTPSLCKHTLHIKQAVEEMEQKGIQLTEFELVTALGFLFFKEQNCDFVVLETGLGGRFDSTNVITAPIASAITSISRDHIRVLGENLGQIAQEKCGILKRGSCAVTTATQDPEVLEVIWNDCSNKKILLEIPEMPSADQIWTDLTGTRFFWQDTMYEIPLLGLHQVENARLALQLIQFVREAGYPVSIQAAKRGLAEVRWPGRLELVSQNPAVLLDTGHNPGGIEMLGRALQDYFPNFKIHTVMGMLSDKEYRHCVMEMAKRSERFYPVAPPIPGRAVPEEVVEELAKPFCRDVQSGWELETILEREIETLAGDQLLLICGSIPLVGAARTILRRTLPIK